MQEGPTQSNRIISWLQIISCSLIYTTLKKFLIATHTQAIPDEFDYIKHKVTISNNHVRWWTIEQLTYN